MSVPKWTVYCHIHDDSSRRYVGITAYTMLHRWNQHCAQAKHLKSERRSHFAAAIRKYGKDAFSHEVLEVCHSLDVANLAEECWIEFFETRNPEKGFNLSRGGGHVPHPVRNIWTAERRAAMSIATKKVQTERPELRAGLTPDAFKGKKHTDATRRRISASGTGRVQSQETLSKISASLKGRDVCPEGRAKAIASLRGKALDAAHRDAIAIGLKAHYDVTLRPPASEMKTCALCHDSRPMNWFNKNQRRKDGLSTRCAECDRKCNRKYFESWKFRKNSRVHPL